MATSSMMFVRSIPTEDETTEWGSVIKWSSVIARPSKRNPSFNCRMVVAVCVCGLSREIDVLNVLRGKYRGMCKACSAKYYVPRGENHSDWKGGFTFNQEGYKLISKGALTKKEYEIVKGMIHPQRLYILEHRLVMALHLGRALTRDEHVHHINASKTDNRIENLQLVSPKEHSYAELTWARQEIKRLREILDSNGIQY